MSAYTYGWALQKDGFVEVPESLYTDEQRKKQRFLKNVSNVVIQSESGWNSVVYKIMKLGNYEAEYAVLSTTGAANYAGGRWINITGNSKGAILRAIGENLE